MKKTQVRLEDISTEYIKFHLEKIRIVREMLAQNIDISAIAEATELEEKQIIRMKKLIEKICKEFNLG